MSQITKIPGGAFSSSSTSSTSNNNPESPGVADMIDSRPARKGLNRPPRERKELTQLRQASWAFSTRRVPVGSGMTILDLDGKPSVGDLVLARVDALGHHAGLQLVNGRRRHLFPGDEVVVAYGHRYASNQFESTVPESFGPCHLAAGGGIASRVHNWHSKISRGPTHITPLGLVGNTQGNRVNLRDYSLAPPAPTGGYEPTTIAIVGTSMDSGKTQSCAYLIRGLVAAGLRAGYVKVTGTGAGGDNWWLHDAGADPVLDFVDVGLPSTYLASPEEVERALTTLIYHTGLTGVDAVVIEIADGVLQRETSVLLKSDLFAQKVGGILMAAGDAMGAAAGSDWLNQIANPVLGLSGVVTSAPLQVREAYEYTGLQSYDRAALATPDVALRLLGGAQDYLSSVDTQAEEVTGV